MSAADGREGSGLRASTDVNTHAHTDTGTRVHAHSHTHTHTEVVLEVLLLPEF